MPERPKGPEASQEHRANHNESRQTVTEPEFKAARIRTEKAQRIATDMKTPGEIAKARAAELRDNELASSQREEEWEKTGKQEIFIYASGYEPGKYKRVYVDPDGKELEEEVILFFQRDPHGKGAVFLTMEGQNGEPTRPLIPAVLYEIGMESHKHAKRPGKKTITVPRIGNRGEYLGTFSILIDVPNKS